MRIGVYLSAVAVRRADTENYHADILPNRRQTRNRFPPRTTCNNPLTIFKRERNNDSELLGNGLFSFVSADSQLRGGGGGCIMLIGLLAALEGSGVAVRLGLGLRTSNLI